MYWKIERGKMLTLKKLVFTFCFPLLCWGKYWDWGRTNPGYGGMEFVLVTIAAFVVGWLTFAFAGRIGEMELRSKVGFLSVCVWIACLGIAIVQLIQDVSWGEPLLFYCSFVPAIYMGCKRLRYPQRRWRIVFSERKEPMESSST